MASLDTAAARAAWLTETVASIPVDSRELLESYSHIAPDAVIPHVIAKRNAAFEVFPYPCIGQPRFLSLDLSTHRLYPKILACLRQGDTLLDVGFCFGQDIRKAVYDWAPAENIAGLDVDQRFVDLGYSLFRDSKTLKNSFTSRIC